MARKSKDTTVIHLYLDGQSAKDELDKIKKKSEETAAQITNLKEEMKGRRAQTDSDYWQQLNTQLEQATERLRLLQKTYNESVKKIKGVDEVMQSLTSSRYDDLTAARTSVQRKVRRLDTTDDDYQKNVENLRAIQAEIDKRKAAMQGLMTEQEASKVMEDLLNDSVKHSVTEIKQAISVTEKLRDTQALGSAEWEKYDKQVTYARKSLNDFNQANAVERMKEQLADTSKLSAGAITEQKKFWEAQIQGAENGSAALAEYEAILKQVTDEEQRRKKDNAEDLMKSLNDGTWKGTINEAKEGLKILTEYRSSAFDTTSDIEGLREVEAAMDRLNEKINEAKEGYMSQEEASNKAQEVMKGTFSGTADDLEKLKKTLIEYQRQQSANDPTAWQKMQKEIDAVDQKLEELKVDGYDLDKVLKQLNGKEKGKPTFEQLELAAKQLERQIKKTEKGTKEYLIACEQLRDVNGQIKEINDQFNRQETLLERSIKRVTAFVASFTSFYYISGKIKQVISDNLKFSDTLADIRKTTGLTNEAVRELSESIDHIDTRTSQQALHELAFEAGKLGVSAKEDVLSFVRAGNQLIVALGEDLGGAEAVRSLMKVNAILGETDTLGMEKALLSTGSAINEISQSSRAAAGPIADMVSRMGAVGAAAHLSMPDLIAIAGTADAMGQNAELASTSLQKFITSVLTNTTDIAYQLGLDPEHLKQLINGQNTIQAIIEILERMNSLGNLDVLAPMMKDMGSDGARMKQVLTTMAAGVDELKAQVFMSNKAFREATSVTNEYNIKNEDAAAIVERIGNNFREYFVNGKITKWLTEFLQWIYEFPKALQRGEFAASSFFASVNAIIGLFTGKTLSTLLSMAWKSINSTWRDLKTTWAATERLLIRNNIAAQGLAGTLERLWIVVKKNPLQILFTILGLLSPLIYKWFENTDKAAKATDDYNVSLEKEYLALTNLKLAIERANVENGERASLIKTLNDRYGEYLGFMVTEANYASNQVEIYRLLNAELQKTLAAKMRDRMMDDVTDKYSDRLRDAQSDIMDFFKDVPGMGAENAAKAYETVLTYVNKAIEDGSDEIKGLYDELYNNFYNTDKDKNDKHVRLAFDAMINRSGVYKAINKLLETQKNIIEETQEAEAYFNAAQKSAADTATNVRKEMLDTFWDKNAYNLENLNTYIGATESYIKGLQNGISGILSKQRQGIALSEKEASTLAQTTQEINSWNSALAFANEQKKELEPKNVWGKSSNLEDMDVRQLVAKYKELEEAGARLATTNEKVIRSQYWEGEKTADEAVKWYYDQAKIVKDRLEELGYNTSGKFKWGSSGSGRGERETRELLQAALAKLEKYFVERQTEIEENRNLELITEEEANRQLEANEEEHLNARRRLREKFLDATAGLTQEEIRKYGLESVNFPRLSAMLRQFGEQMVDGIGLQAATDSKKVQDLLLKHKKAIEKTLLEDDFTAKAAKEWMDSIDQLDLLFGLQEAKENRTQKLGEQRLDILTRLSHEAYRITAEELEERMAAYTLFDEWRIGRTQEDYQALLVMLRKYNDDYLAAEKQAADRSKKIAESRWNAQRPDGKGGYRLSEADEYAVRMARQEARITAARKGQEWGIGGQDLTDDEELKLYELKIEMSQRYLQQLELEMEEKIKMAADDVRRQEELLKYEQERGIDNEITRERAAEATERYESLKRQQMEMTLEARKSLADAETELMNKQIEHVQNTVEKYMEYAQIMQEGAQSFGEAVFGNKEDRQNAAKQMLSDVLTTTKNILQQYLIQIATKQQLNQMEVAMEQAKQAQLMAIYGQDALAQLGVTAATAQADVVAGTASGTAKEVAKRGLLGLATSTLIGVALSALLGLALGAINKSKSTVKSETKTGSRKLSTGMLTYAEGKYPVMGNDGQVYDATYEPELKTGIYKGGAHYGIFSEKEPEAVIDGETTRRLVLDYPWIWDNIVNVSRTGKPLGGIPAYADGKLPERSDYNASSGSNDRLSDTLDQMNVVIAMLQQTLTDGSIRTEMDVYGHNGAYSKMSAASRFLKRVKKS